MTQILKNLAPLFFSVTCYGIDVFVFKQQAI
jgi:hypothetical protein